MQQALQYCTADSTLSLIFMATAACLAADDAAFMVKTQLSGCPNDDWHDHVMSLPSTLKLTTEAGAVLVNVGANKGYQAVEHLSRFAPQHNLSARSWHAAIREYAKAGTGRTDGRPHGYLLAMGSCGACGDCANVAPSRFGRRGLPRRSTHVHLLELAPANRALLRSLGRRFGLSDVVTVHDLAASNESHVARAPRHIMAGFEVESLCGGSTKGNCDPRLAESVRTTTIDDFATSFDLRRVYHLKIDVEGWDALVVEGSRQLLSARRVHLLEFEYSGHGMWGGGGGGHAPWLTHGQRSLFVVMRELWRYGYMCFMQGRCDLLGPVNGPCWHQRFETHKWSNVLCSADAMVIRLLQNRTNWSAASRQAGLWRVWRHYHAASCEWVRPPPGQCVQISENHGMAWVAPVEVRGKYNNRSKSSCAGTQQRSPTSKVNPI